MSWDVYTENYDTESLGNLCHPLPSVILRWPKWTGVFRMISSIKPAEMMLNVTNPSSQHILPFCMLPIWFLQPPTFLLLLTAIMLPFTSQLWFWSYLCCTHSSSALDSTARHSDSHIISQIYGPGEAPAVSYLDSWRKKRNFKMCFLRQQIFSITQPQPPVTQQRNCSHWATGKEESPATLRLFFFLVVASHIICHKPTCQWYSDISL